MDKDIVLKTILVGDIEGKFLVPSYQRGYRWDSFEVKQLLDDIYQNGNNTLVGNRSYCLQPIVIKRISDDTFELIDGQQRLTTLYLIYRYMKDVNSFYSDPLFSLVYETRERSEEFLKEIDESRRDECIDFWYMFNAYETIKKWFEIDLQIRVINIFKYLKENVKVIWYEVGEAEDSVGLFTRLNIGKIPLTSAELIKAMFLCKDAKAQIDRKKQEEISLQWDNMEKELHDDSFWFFLTNKTEKDYQTRIDLILDLLSRREPGKQEKYYTFYKLDEMRQKEPVEDIWFKIQRAFLIAKDWYEDHELYHKIGYLIASNTKTLGDIFVLAEDKKKTDFRSLLDGIIKESIIFDKPYSELSYDNPQDLDRIGKLLLLFNVESVRQNGEETQWFPFNKHKYDGDNQVAWTLEHIHAQQSEGMKTQDSWKQWVRLHLKSIETVCPDEFGLIDEMNDAISIERLDRVKFETIQRKVLDLLSETGSDNYMHSISNLALLNANTNAALSNSTFDVKRNEIINRDKKGQYIPFCTKMVFLKYYTQSSETQLHFWGVADRKAYINAINEVLSEYLSDEIDGEEEE